MRIRLPWTAVFFLVLAFGSLCLLWPALTNRFPLVYWDSGTYLKSSFSFEVPIDRPVFYSLWIALARFFATPLLGIITLQAWLIGALLLALLERRFFIPVLIGVSAFSNLPWFTSQIMPDFFTGALCISFYLIFWRWQSLSSTLRIFAVTVMSASILVHFSHIPISMLLLALLFLLKQGNFRSFARIGSVITGSIAVILITNYPLTGRGFVSESSSTFLTGRLIQTGILQKLLREHCSDQSYALCPYRDYFESHNSDDYLWNEQSPLEKIGGWKNSREQSRRMILDSLYYYPFDHLKNAVFSSIKLLGDFDIGDGLQEPYTASKTVFQQIAEKYSQSLQSFQNSRQQTGRLWSLVQKANIYYLICFLIALTALGIAWLKNRERPLITFVALFFLANAIGCATLSGPVNRYQARVSWLIVLAALIAWLPRRNPETVFPQ